MTEVSPAGYVTKSKYDLDMQKKDEACSDSIAELVKRAEFAESEVKRVYCLYMHTIEHRITEVRKLQKRLYGWRKKKEELREEIEHLKIVQAEDREFYAKQSAVKVPAVTEQVYTFATDVINLLNNTCPAKSAEAVTLLHVKVHKLRADLEGLGAVFTVEVSGQT